MPGFMMKAERPRQASFSSRSESRHDAGLQVGSPVAKTLIDRYGNPMADTHGDLSNHYPVGPNREIVAFI